MTPDNQPALPDCMEFILVEMRTKANKLADEAGDGNHKLQIIGREVAASVTAWADRLESLRRAEGATLPAGAIAFIQSWASETCGLDEHDAGVAWACKELKRMLESEGATLGEQIDRLAKFIMDEIPGEPSQSEGAVDTAIRLLRERATPTAQRVAAGDLKDHATTLALMRAGYSVDLPARNDALDAAMKAMTPPPTGEAVAWIIETTFVDAGPVKTIAFKKPDPGNWPNNTKFTPVYTHPAAQAEGRGVDDAFLEYVHTAPPGWVTVPMEPTGEMLEDGDREIAFGNDAADVYRAMLAVAGEGKVRGREQELICALQRIANYDGDPLTPVHNAVKMRGIARAALTAPADVGGGL